MKFGTAASETPVPLMKFIDDTTMMLSVVLFSTLLYHRENLFVWMYHMSLTALENENHEPDIAISRVALPV